MNQHAQIWSRLETALAESAPRMLEALRPPATVLQISEAEQALGISFPEELRVAYLRHDGQSSKRERPFYPSLFMSHDWLPLADLVSEWKKSMEIARMLEEEHSEQEGSLDENGMVRSLGFWSSKWIPVGKEWGRARLFIDLHPGFRGSVGQLVQHSGEDYPADESVVSNGLAAYVSRLADCLEAGRLTLGEHGWRYRFGDFVSVFDLDDVLRGKAI